MAEPPLGSSLFSSGIAAAGGAGAAPAPAPAASAPAPAASANERPLQVTSLATFGEEKPLGIAVSPKTGIVYTTSMRDRRIRTIDPKTGAKGILVHLPNSPEGLAVSPTTDFVYATNSRASCIYEINPETKAYKILAVGAGLTSPRGLAVSKAGLLYVADLDTNCIHTIDVGSGIAKILAGSVCGYADAAGGDRWVNDGVAAKFNSPTGVAIAPSGTLYVTDALNMCIRKIDPTTGAVSTVSGLPLSSPCGIAVSSEGILYIADTGNNRILRFDPLTGEKKILADSGSPGFLESPGGVAVGPSPSDEIYVADTDNYRVCVIAPSTKEPTAASRLNRRTTRHRKANRKTHRSRKTRRSQ